VKLKRDFECQRKELAVTRRELGELKKENQQKSSECQEALKSLKELQNELMRKSMHVGSLGKHSPYEVNIKLIYLRV
jgi:kinesin family protein C2/C3